MLLDSVTDYLRVRYEQISWFARLFSDYRAFPDITTLLDNERTLFLNFLGISKNEQSFIADLFDLQAAMNQASPPWTTYAGLEKYCETNFPNTCKQLLGSASPIMLSFQMYINSLQRVDSFKQAVVNSPYNQKKEKYARLKENTETAVVALENFVGITDAAQEASFDTRIQNIKPKCLHPNFFSELPKKNSSSYEPLLEKKAQKLIDENTLAHTVAQSNYIETDVKKICELFTRISNAHYGRYYNVKIDPQNMLGNFDIPEREYKKLRSAFENLGNAKTLKDVQSILETFAQEKPWWDFFGWSRESKLNTQIKLLQAEVVRVSSPANNNANPDDTLWQDMTPDEATTVERTYEEACENLTQVRDLYNRITTSHLCSVLNVNSMENMENIKVKNHIKIYWENDRFKKNKETLPQNNFSFTQGPAATLFSTTTPPKPTFVDGILDAIPLEKRDPVRRLSDTRPANLQPPTLDNSQKITNYIDQQLHEYNLENAPQWTKDILNQLATYALTRCCLGGVLDLSATNKIKAALVDMRYICSQYANYTTAQESNFAQTVYILLGNAKDLGLCDQTFLGRNSDFTNTIQNCKEILEKTGQGFTASLPFSYV